MQMKLLQFISPQSNSTQILDQGRNLPFDLGDFLGMRTSMILSIPPDKHIYESLAGQQ